MPFRQKPDGVGMSSAHHHPYLDPTPHSTMRGLRCKSSAPPSTPPTGTAFGSSGVQRSKSIRMARLSPDLMQRFEEAQVAEEDIRPIAAAHRLSGPAADPMLQHEGESAHRFYSSLPMPVQFWSRRNIQNTPSPPKGRGDGARAMRGLALEPLDREQHLLESIRLDNRHHPMIFPPTTAGGSGGDVASSSSTAGFRVSRHCSADNTSVAHDLRQQLAAAQSRVTELVDALRQQRDVKVPTLRQDLLHRISVGHDDHLRHVALLAWCGCVRAKQMSVARERTLWCAHAWATSTSDLTRIKVFTVWRAATHNRRTVSALQTKLFGEMAYRSAALDAQKREFEVRLLEEEAEHRETVRRLRADLADGESRHAEALKKHEAEATQRLAAAEADFTQALREALRRPAQDEGSNEDVKSILGASSDEVATTTGGSVDTDARLAGAIRSLQARADARFSELETRHAESLQTERERYAQMLSDEQDRHTQALRRAKEAADRRVSDAENRHAEMIRELQEASDQRLADLEMRHTRTLRALQGTLCEDLDFADCSDSMDTLNQSGSP